MLTIILVFSCLLVLWCLLFLRSNAITLINPNVSVSNDTDRYTASLGIASGISLTTTRGKLRDLIVPSARREINDAQVVDCTESLHFCTSDADCSVMCRTYETVSFHCDARTHSCQPLNTSVRTPSPGGDGDDDDNNRSFVAACNVKAGEYAMLVGYTNLGAALWQCVQLYKQFSGSFCESGVFNMDARMREPSYRDCPCPKGTVRMSKKLADQYDTQLPHCITAQNVRFYTDDMVVV